MPKPRLKKAGKFLGIIAASIIGFVAGRTLSTIPISERGRILKKETAAERKVERKIIKVPIKAKLNKKQIILLTEALCKKLKSEINPNFFKALIQIESNYNPKAIGKHNDKGLLQLTPIAIKQIAKLGFRITNPFDIEQNIIGGILLAKYNKSIAKFKTIKTRKGFKKVKRKYLYNGKLVEFDQLPKEIQLKILAEMHNKGPSFVKDSEKKEIEEKFTKYAKRFWEMYKVFK